MNKLALCASLIISGLLITICPASAQLMVPVVSSCGTPPQTYSAGASYPLTQDTTGKLCTGASGGGGGAVTIADGADVALGLTTQAACAAYNTSGCSLLQVARLQAFEMTQAATVNPTANATGGATPYHHYSATTAGGDTQNVKNAAGTIYWLSWSNTTAVTMEIKLYNLSSAPTCSSATGVVSNIVVPANASAPGALTSLGSTGMNFSTGISFCIVAVGAPPADTDATAATAGLVINLGYN